MFNGIIRNQGKIIKTGGNADLKTLQISYPSPNPQMREGDSIAVDGVCLTVKEFDADTFTVEVMPETLGRTIIESYQPEHIVNLESPLKVGDNLDGHFLSGHVDYTGKVIETETLAKTKNIKIDIPESYRKYFAIKGSVAVNGVSLTVSSLDTGLFTVSIIPLTLADTNLASLKKDDRVNIEIDIFSRYLDSLMENKENQITYSFLRERNFI